MRQKNRATGHHQTVAWDTFGTKTIKVQVIPPAWTGLKGATLTTTVENRDPDVEFSGKTWAIDPSGIGAIPTGSTRVASYDEAFAAMQTAAMGRVLFQRGATYDVGTFTNRGAPTRAQVGGTMFDCWGPETDPLPIMDISGDGFSWTRPENNHFVLIKNLRHVGGYDGATGNNAGSRKAWRINANAYWTFNGCDFEKVQTGLEQLSSTDAVGPEQFALWNSKITGWEDYGTYITGTDKALIRGNAIFQDPAYVGSSPEGKNLDGSGPVGSTAAYNYPDHGPLRFAFMNNSVMVIFQIKEFSANGWSNAGLTRDGLQLKSHQPFLRIAANEAEGLNSLINECWAEGRWSLDPGVGAAGISGAAFISMFGNYTLGTANGSSMVSLGHSGLWMHDNVFLRANIEVEDTNRTVVFEWGSNNSKVTTNWHTKPVRIFNNTYGYLLSIANHQDGVKTITHQKLMEPPIILAGGTVPAQVPEIIRKNNLLWVPNQTLEGEAAPRVPDGIHSAGAWGAPPLYQGLRLVTDAEVLVFRSIHATPATAAILPALSTTTTLDGTADTTLCAAMDGLRRIATSTPTPGAVQPKVRVPA